MDLLEFKLYIGKCLALGAQTTVSQDPRPSTPDEESSRPAKKCKKSKIPPRDVRTTEQTLAIGEVVEVPENGDHADDGNILAADPSNVTQKLGFLESSEPSNICNLR
ncbi:unnamed protein product [Acanthoscelides obtectus]|uniref:Uncharacterized protein n=1 Tax=Acanthoscelides obtectus TaxID=200917 RepID=A0A9P0JRU3_ACAOB|nr:unnamed protein product [Acanthoscelides obtectus]CAK1621289.1 hypothetical protein AOBTE_LOCUS869 [Acanthoscelides obtectus]